MPVLHKYSTPGWSKEFNSNWELTTELRKFICRDCLEGKDLAVSIHGDLNEVETTTVDTEYNGKIFKCHDVDTLLSTNCGLEFGVTD